MKLNEFNKKLNDSANFNISKSLDNIPFENYITNQNYKKTNIFKTFAFSLSGIIIVLIFSFYLYYNSTPYVVLTIDINPSIEIKLNRFNRVIEVSGLNEDGDTFLSGMDINKMPLNDFLEMIYEKGLEENYFTDTNAEALIGIYGTNYDSENKVLTLINESNQINSLAILYHSDNQGVLYSQEFVDDDNSIIDSIIDYYSARDSEFKSSDYDGALEKPDYSTSKSIEFSVLPATEEEFINLAEELNISITKLNIVRYIYENSSDYTNVSDFIELTNDDISTLIQLYEDLQ